MNKDFVINFVINFSLKIYQSIYNIFLYTMDKLDEEFSKLNFQNNHSPNQENDLEDLKFIIDKNLYINNIKVNKEREENSLSYLISKELSQSECIRLGTAIEKLLVDIILDKNPDLINIKSKNEKGKKEKDNLFCNEKLKVIYYAEIKSNLNLDTEKSVSTINKCIDIQNELKEIYPNYEIKMFLVGIRYFDKAIIPTNISKKYSKISDNLVGVNNYFSSLDIKFNFKDENTYKKVLNYISDKMFE
jgi:hypothetical protein